MSLASRSDGATPPPAPAGPPCRVDAGPRRGVRRGRLARLLCGAAGACLALAAGGHRALVTGAGVHSRPRARTARRAAEGDRLYRPAPVLEKKSAKQRETVTAIQPSSWFDKPKPPTLPMGLFKPKESLAQTFLADPNIIYKMVEAIEDDSPNGRNVLELGPGTGALTSRLYPRFPEMFSIELDQRAMRVLAAKVPGITCIRSDVLLVNYTKLAEIRGGPLTIIGNLPYRVSTQLLFALCDHANSVKTASVTMQKEVAKRVCARPGSKDYGIPSVAFQLYSDPKRLFDLPQNAFFPRPNVESSYVQLDFEAARERREQLGVDPRNLRKVVKSAFRQRKKKLENSLARLLHKPYTLIDEMPPEYAFHSASHLEPWEYVHLTQLMFGEKQFPRHLRRAWRGEFGRTVKAKEYGPGVQKEHPAPPSPPRRLSQ